MLDLKKDYENEKTILINKVERLETPNQDLSAIVVNLESENSNLKKKEAEMEKTVSNIQSADERLGRQVNEVSRKIDNYEPTAPLNSVYIQYPYELEPSKLWKCVKYGRWADISNTYANLFFRVNGNKSSFKSVQEENTPRIDIVRFEWCNVH